MASMDFPDGFHGLADGFHGISRWIPYCFHSGVHMESMESIWNEFMDWNFQMDSILFKSDLMPPQNSIQNSYVNIDIVLIIFT